MSCDCINTATSIAEEIVMDLDNDSSLSVSYITSWIRNNVGKVNNMLGVSFELDNNLEYTPCIDNNVKDIIKNMYICHYYNLQAKSNLGASAFDVIEVRDGDSVGRVANKTDKAKVLATIAKQCSEDLAEVIKFYKANRCLPMSISSATTSMYLFSRDDDN